MMSYHRIGVGRRCWVAVAALLAALSVAGCDDPPRRGRDAAPPTAAVPAGTSERTLWVDDRERTYRLYRPPQVPLTGPVPLVVMLHGVLGSGEQAESSYGWNAVADRGRFLVIYPDGLNRAWAVSPQCCGAPARDGVNDVGFVTRLTEALIGELPINPDRVYVAGISNGGMLAYQLACQTRLFAAVAPVAATLLGECTDPGPLSVLHIHGDADRTVPYGGGPGRQFRTGRQRLPATVDGPPVPELIDRWRRVAGCPPAVPETVGPVITSAARCPHGREVTLITVAGAGHQWPGGSQPGRGALPLDPPATALDATDTIWRFFQAHPRQT